MQINRPKFGRAAMLLFTMGKGQGSLSFVYHSVANIANQNGIFVVLAVSVNCVVVTLPTASVDV